LILKPSLIFIEKEIADSAMVADICAHLKAPVRLISSAREAYSYISSARDPVKAGKQTLLLSKNRGAFIKSCPGTKAYRCCGYQILHIGSFCNMDCAYCILQSYFHPPVCQFFVNHDDLFAELNATLSIPGIKRVGTGEFTDSLIWDNWTDLTARLVQWFATQTRSVLELKTKTVSIDSLRNQNHQRKTMVAWSLNTPAIIKSEERGTASLNARLRAAKTCASWGYPIAFHFDPIVIYEGCEKDYEGVIQNIFKHVSPDNIVWISLGTLRFMPQLKPIIQERFPESKIPYGELIPGLDNKMRYFKPLRVEIYRHMVETLRRLAPDVTVYFCMEDDEVWEKVMGFIPAEKGGLSAMLDESAIRHCGLRL